MLIVCDIDGTLFNNEHRKELIPVDRSKTEHWREFNARHIYDQPIGYRIQILNLIALMGATIVYVTSRSEEFRDETRCKLSMEKCPAGQLLMRPADDHRPSAQVNVDLMRDIVGDGRFVLIDDDVTVCAAVAVAYPKVSVIKVPSQDCAYLPEALTLEAAK